MDAKTNAGSIKAVLVTVRKIRIAIVVCYGVLCVCAGVVLAREPAQFESLLASAQQAQARGDFDAAAAFYKKAAAVRPEIPELRTNLGLMYYQAGKDEAAIEAFRQAIRIKPRLFVPNFFLGLDYLKLKRFGEAISYLKQAAILKPMDAQAQFALGQAYAEIGNTRLAIASYSHALQLIPQNADGWFHLGVTYLEQVEADARLLVSRHKDSGYLHALVAETFVQQGKFIQAAEAYKTTLSYPDFPPGTHAGYGFVLLNQQRFAEADQEFKAELAVTPGSLLAKLGLARLRIEHDAASDALRQVEAIWKAEPGFLRTHVSLLKTGLAPQRRSELERVLDEREREGEISQEFATLVRSDTPAKRPTDALEHWRSLPANTVATSSPFHVAAELFASGSYRECSDLLAPRFQRLNLKDLRLLASCAYSIGDYRAAVAAAQKLTLNPATEAEGLYWETKSAQKLATDVLVHASEVDSTSPQLHLLLGDLYRQKMYAPDAEREYRKALALRPEDTGALFGLSLALFADSKIDKAFRLAQDALKQNPDDPEINAVMGEILCARHDYAEAEPYLKKGLNTKPELVPHVHALLGKVYAETNRIHQAIAELKLGLADDKDGSLHYQIARLYLKVGDRDSAKEAFKVSDRMHREGLARAAVAMQQGEVAIKPR